MQGDVAKAADVKKIFAETKQAFGRLDILSGSAAGAALSADWVAHRRGAFDCLSR